jgi:hypothetical protein
MVLVEAGHYASAIYREPPHKIRTVVSGCDSAMREIPILIERLPQRRDIQLSM